VIDEIRALRPGFDVVVVDDGSSTARPAVAATRARTSSGCPSTSASAAPSRPVPLCLRARLRLAVQVDGDGQHDLGSSRRPRAVLAARPTSSSARASRPRTATQSSLRARLGIRCSRRRLGVVRQR
jgi:hypothetical protein